MIGYGLPAGIGYPQMTGFAAENTFDTPSQWVTQDSQGARWIAANSTFCVMPKAATSSAKLIGLTGFTKSSLGSSVAIGVAGAAIADHATNSCWAGYFDLQVESGGTGFGYGIEIAVKNKGSDVTTTPNTTGTGSAFGIQLSGGGDNAYGGSAANPSAAAVIVTKNAHTFNRAFVVRNNAITGCDASTGTAVAFEVGRGHKFQWQNGSAKVANIYAEGTGDDMDLVFTTAGAGTLQFGTRTAIGAETVTGYITIKDSGGTTRKLAVVS